MPTATFPLPEVVHSTLGTTFYGVEHALSVPEAPVHQYRGIKYASVPARFRQSKLYHSYPQFTDTSKYGPVCPQVKYALSVDEELFGLSDVDIPQQHPVKQNEFECLNLNITCPAGLTPASKLPIMVWIHGGADRGAGSSWICDAGALVQKSMLAGKPVIVVNFNFRLGLFGFAASPLIREDNKAAGDEGVGNYGLRDQQRALEWIHFFIAEFGGNPANVTLFGESTGAADIVSHRLSARNATGPPLFHRAIIQSPVADEDIPTVSTAGWHLSRIKSTLRVQTVAQLRAVEPERLVSLRFHSLRATDDGTFFRADWKDYLHPDHAHTSHANSHPHHHTTGEHGSHAHPHPHRPLQPLIIGDCTADSLIWSLPASLWTSSGASKRIKAVCQSIHKSNELMRAYDISPHTPEDEITERVLELINDARVAWPAERIARGVEREYLHSNATGVWRYVFDQEGPTRGIPHHAADLAYLFNNIPLPSSSSSASLGSSASGDCFETGSFGDSDSDDEIDSTAFYGSDQWDAVVVDAWSFARVRDAMQERWLAFAYGEVPWNKDKIYVFGPEGETGERSMGIFHGRRRTGMWKEVLSPLGVALVQKVGIELSRGPVASAH